MLLARSAPEAHLYMDLHACECGSTVFNRNHRMELHDNNLVAIYEGPCRECGENRRFEFRMAEEIAPPAPAFGGDEPSRIIDPGEFLHIANRYSTYTGSWLLSHPESERHRMRNGVTYILALYDEILKFIPPETDTIPAESFTSDIGKKLYQQDPENFQRDILEIDIKSTRRVLASIDRVGPPATP